MYIKYFKFLKFNKKCINFFFNKEGFGYVEKKNVVIVLCIYVYVDLDCVLWIFFV